MHRSRKICAICWIDSKAVFLLSTAINPVDPNAVAGRWIGRERVVYPTSPILMQYQSNMRGVDLLDQKREYYSVQLQSQKWRHKVFMFVIDSSLDNSYVLYCEDQRELGLPVHARALWRLTLAEALVNPFVRAGNLRVMCVTWPREVFTECKATHVTGHTASYAVQGLVAIAAAIEASLFATGSALSACIHSLDFILPPLLTIVGEFADQVVTSGSGMDGQFGGEMVAFLAWLDNFVDKI